MLVSIQVGQEKDQRRQDDSYTDRAGYVEPTKERTNPKELQKKMKKKARQ